MKLPIFLISYCVITVIQSIQFCHAQECSKPVVVHYEFSDEKGLDMQTFDPKPLADGQTIYDFLLYYLPGYIVQLEDPVEMTGGIADPNFDLVIPSGTTDTKREIFGVEIDATDFTLRFYNYFHPKISGYYTFSVSADDAAMVSIMDDFTYMCCKNITIDYSGNQQQLEQRAHKLLMETYQNFSTIIQDTGSPDDTKEVSMYLAKDTPVQVDMVVINRSGNAKFDLSVTDPDGNSILGQEDYWYDPEDGDVHCDRISNVTETADVIATTTYSSRTITSLANVFAIVEYHTIYYVQVPSEVPVTSSSVPEPSSSTVESSSELTSEVTSSVVSSSLESSIVSSSTIEISSEITSEVTSSVVSSSLESSIVSSSTIEISSESSSEIPSSIGSSSTVSSIELSLTVVSSTTEPSDSSTYIESSTGSLSSYSSNVVPSSESSQLTSSAISPQTTSSAVISTEITSSDTYYSGPYTSSNVESQYTNSSSIEPPNTSETSVITTDTPQTETKTYDSEIKSRTTLTLPCSSDKCNTAPPISSTEYTTSFTRYYTTTVTTLCSVTHENSIEVTTSTYTTIIESVITHPACSGDCSDDSIHVSQTGPLVAVSQVSSTSYPQVLTSSTAHLVDINENNGIHFSSSIVVLFISLLSILTLF